MEKSIVCAVLEKLGSLIPEEIKQNVGMALGIEEEIRKMTNNFEEIKSVLEDAETKQVKDANVRNWLKKLKDVAYDVDDVLDEWNSAKLRSQLEKEERDVENGPLLKKIRYSISTFTSKSILYYNIAVKIKELNEVLDRLNIEKDRYKLDLEKEVEEPRRYLTASFIDEEEVYGRCEEIRNVVNMLVQENWSRILITTRKEKVAMIMGTKQANLFPLHTLSREECWSLLSRRALYGRAREEFQSLEDISRKIAEKCQGLPLAAKILGGLLQFKKTREQWQRVLDSEIWNLEEAEQDLFPPLFLSYYELPLALKQCISYCAVFPKDKILNKDELIKLWMAQNYLGEAQCKEMEIVGEEYFDELMMRSFFQDFRRAELDSGIVECKMHDIIHDFLQHLTKPDCLILVNHGFEELRVDSCYERARHVTLIREKTDLIDPTLMRGKAAPKDPKFIHVPADLGVYCFRKLRSLLVDSSNHDTSSLSTSLPMWCDQFTCLRTLNLSNSLFGDSIEELPDQIGNLVHLRYLNLKHNRKLKQLPESLCELCNLQTLNLTWCARLEELPCGMGKLINLRHLENEKTDLSLMAMPKGIGRLTCLQTLSVFVVTDGGSNEASTLGDLGNLLHLQGHLKISRLGIVGVTEAKKAKLQNKKGLRGLVLEFNGPKGLMLKRLRRGNDIGLLEALQPPLSLEKLEISCYCGPTVFPTWMKDLTKLRHVSLGFCFDLNVLPPLGKLQSLESLYIGGMGSLQNVGFEFLGVDGELLALSSSSIVAFPSLKHLEFRDMQEWDNWISSGGEEHISIMPHLCSLTIDSCPKLRSLPCYILQNTSLKQLDISQSPILSERCRKETGEDWLNICHIPSIIIDGLCIQVNSSCIEEFGVLQLQPLNSSLLNSNDLIEAFRQD
ncbi:hypothetical protein COLO4_30385 [Corchorus olitorius]|uniref:Disease resistance protein n=1 Tax=Corchorus olitorius TaxID=93759 RepID=A0A1R3H951_9ROSI|nr:hypothetical protein COLO4_30385 [Corchorus olitorius]